MLNPDALLLDEPLAALDPLVRADLQTELRDIFSALKKTVLMVTHDLAEASFFAASRGAVARRADRARGERRRPVAPPGRLVRHSVRAGPARPGGPAVTVPRIVLPSLVCVALAVVAVVPGCRRSAGVVVGAKKFTESVILAEIGVQLARDAGADCPSRRPWWNARTLAGADPGRHRRLRRIHRHHHAADSKGQSCPTSP